MKLSRELQKNLNSNPVTFRGWHLVTRRIVLIHHKLRRNKVIKMIEKIFLMLIFFGLTGVTVGYIAKNAPPVGININLNSQVFSDSLVRTETIVVKKTKSVSGMVK